MARTIQQIQQSIITNFVNKAAANGITIDPSQWSDYDYRQLITFAAAADTSIVEQLWDAYMGDMELLVASAAPQTNVWLQNIVLNIFQYSSTVPQNIQFDTINFAPYYPVVDPSLRIVTQCAIVPGYFGTTNILVAKGGATPVALSTGTGSELEALQGFLNTMTVPGITINAQSSAADKMYLDATVTFNGQYSSIIQSTVVAAINAYLRAIPVTGVVSVNSPIGLMKLTDLIIAVRSVPGVIDFQLNNVNVRPDGVSFTAGVNNMVSMNNWILNEWNSGLQGGAGYIVGETTTGYTLNDSITYNAV